MKKIALSGAVILAFIFYSFHQKDEEANVRVVAPSLPTSSPTPNNTAAPTTTTTSSASSPYKDGTYTGIVADAYYGPYQVAAVISGGKISNINFLQYPNDRGTSIEINSQAMPFLKQEAIAAQNANVDIVSGATQSSNAFRQSLQSALDKARS